MHSLSGLWSLGPRSPTILSPEGPEEAVMFCHLPPVSPTSHRLRHSRLLEAPHAVQNVELLPPFGKIHFPINVVWVSQVDKGEVLKDEPPEDGEDVNTLSAT